MSLGPELLFAQAEEINKSLANNRIRKVEAADSWLALIFSADRSLLFSWDPDFYGCSTAAPKEIRELTEIAKNRPPILSAVKSHIVGSDLIQASVLHRDRVLLIEFRKTIGAGFYQKKFLLFEASGRYSNIMLLDEDRKIVEIAKHIHADTNRYRSMSPGLPYTPPPPFAGIRVEDFSADDPGALEALEKIVGVGKPLLSALKKICRDAPERRTAILKGLDFFKEDGDHRGEKIFYSLNGYLTLYPVSLPGAEKMDATHPLDAARAVVVSPLLERVVSRERKKLRAILENSLGINAKKIKETEAGLASGDEAEKNLLYGKLILANAWAIPPRADEAKLPEWTERGEVEHTVALDPGKDAPANAERYFARYRKKKASMEHAKKALPALYARRDELQEQLVLLEHQSDPTTLALMAIEIESAKRVPVKPAKRGKSSKSPSLPPHARYEIHGATLFVGLSAKGNHYVTFRLARPDDIWLHAQKIPGAHVIVRFEETLDETAETEIFETAAASAAYYSKGRESGHVRVDYAERKHVRAIPGGGLAHVTYREFGTITADVSLWEKFLAERSAAPAEEKP